MEKETELFEGEIPYSDGISESLSNFFESESEFWDRQQTATDGFYLINVKLYALSLAITFL